MSDPFTVGVLALQGGFAKHLEKVALLGVKGVEVRTTEELEACDALILPGGESTTMSKLLVGKSLFDALLKWEKPLFATCAGLILLSKWGKLDVAVQRNGYGRQCDSFVATFPVRFPEKVCPCTGVFIRAPKIVGILSDRVEVLATYHGEKVMVRQGNLLAATFHPELTDENEIHRFFIHGIGRKNRCLDECRKEHLQSLPQ